MMNHFWKKAAATLGIVAVSASFMTVYQANTAGAITNKKALANKTITTTNGKLPKYIFLFIGDGMSYPQIQSASYYMGTNKSKGGSKQKSFRL